MSRAARMGAATLLLAATLGAGPGLDAPSRSVAAQEPIPDRFLYAYDVRDEPGALDGPSAVAPDGRGGLWVADAANARVQRLDARGEAILLLGERGAAPGRFLAPRDLVAQGDELWVSDDETRALQVFDSEDGRLLRRWTAEDGAFEKPAGLGAALDGGRDGEAEGGVWLADRGRNRVLRLDREGRVLTSFGGPGLERGRFNGLVDVAQGPDGDVWTLEARRIQRFRPDGTWRWSREDEVVLERAWSLTVHPRSGAVFVADREGGRVHGYDRHGSYRGVLPPAGVVGAGAAVPTGLAVDPAGAAGGELLVADAGTHRVLRYDVAATPGELRETYGRAGFGPGHLQRPLDVALAPDGTLVVADADHFRLQRFDPAGRPMASYGRLGRAPGEFYTPEGLAVDPEGRIFVQDGAQKRMQRLSAEGEPEALWGSWGPNATFAHNGVALDAAGRVFVADRKRPGVLVFDEAGRLLDDWGERGAGAGELRHPTGLAVLPDGSVLLADWWLHRLARFAADGRPMGAFAEEGQEPGQLLRPEGLALLPDGRGGARVVVADAGNRRLQAFTLDGDTLGAWGGDGAPEPAPFGSSGPSGLAWDGQRLYAADRDRHRLLVYGAQLAPTWRLTAYEAEASAGPPTRVLDLGTAGASFAASPTAERTLRLERTLPLDAGLATWTVTARAERVRLWVGDRLLVDEAPGRGVGPWSAVRGLRHEAGDAHVVLEASGPARGAGGEGADLRLERAELAVASRVWLPRALR